MNVHLPVRHWWPTATAILKGTNGQEVGRAALTNTPNKVRDMRRRTR
jgi:hypothetical protein